MIRELQLTEVFDRETLNLPLQPSGKGLTAAGLAEFLRAALYGLYDDSPVSVQRLVGLTQERLSAVSSFQSSLFEKLFQREEDSSNSRSELRYILEWLVQVGDVLSVGEGLYYPAPTRCVQLDASLFLVVSGTPTDELEQEVGGDGLRGTIGRFLTFAPPNVTIQSLNSWLQLSSIDLVAWAQRQIRGLLPAFPADASKWEIAQVGERQIKWVPTPQAINFHDAVIARYKRERIPGYQRFLARLKRDGMFVVCTNAKEITFEESNRILQGIRLKNGLHMFLRYRKVFDYLTIETHRYHLPEVMKLLTAFAQDRIDTDEDLIHLTIPCRADDQLRRLLRHFAIELLPQTRR